MLIGQVDKSLLVLNVTNYYLALHSSKLVPMSCWLKTLNLNVEWKNTELGTSFFFSITVPLFIILNTLEIFLEAKTGD